MSESETAEARITREEILQRIPGRIPGRFLATFGLLALAGLVGFFLGLAADPQRAWQAYLVNFLFFSGLAAAGVVFGAIIHVARGHWGKPMLRIAQGFGAFLPASFALFLLLYFGRYRIFPWIGRSVDLTGAPLRTAWLNVGGVFGRGTVFLFAFYAACFMFIYYTVRPDMAAVAPRLDGWRRRLAERIGRGWRGDAEELARSRRVLGRLAPALVLAYAVVLSGMAVDLIMSLAPGWNSILFPAYFFIGAWLSALAATAVMASLTRRRMDLDAFAPNHWHDLGKLIFAFCIFWTYLWFSQFLVIWYGNMPRETAFIRPRMLAPWAPVSIAFFVMVFPIPFVLLLGQKAKMIPGYLASVAGVILLGFWLERFDMVVPSIWKSGGVPLGWIELLVTLGFLGLFGLCYALYASTFPMVPLDEESLLIGQPRKGPY